MSCPPSIHPPLFCLTTQNPSLERVWGTTKVGFDDVFVEHILCSTSLPPLQFLSEAKERYHLVLFLLLLYVHVRTYRTHRLHEGPPPKVSEPSAKPINHLAAAASLSAHLSLYTHSAFITRKGGWKGEPPLSLPKVPPFPPPPPPISLLFQHMCNIYIPVFICLYIFPLSSSPVPADILSSFSSTTTVASLPSYERTYSPVWPFGHDIRRLIFTRAYYETGKLCRCFLNKAGNEHRTLKLSNPSSRQHLSVRIATKRSIILPPDPKASILVPQQHKKRSRVSLGVPIAAEPRIESFLLSSSSSSSFFPPLSVRRLLVLSPLFPSSSSSSSFPFPACSAAKAWSKAQNGESAQESFLPRRNNSILTFPLSAFEGQFQKGIAYCFQKKKEKNGVGKDGPWSVQKRAPIPCAQNIGHPKVNFSLSIFLLGHPSRRPLACRERERERERLGRRRRRLTRPRTS